MLYYVIKQNHCSLEGKNRESLQKYVKVENVVIQEIAIFNTFFCVSDFLCIY